MKKKINFSSIKFSQPISDGEVVLKFVPTDLGLGIWNEILLLINRAYVRPDEVLRLLEDEFQNLSGKDLPQEFDTPGEFVALQSQGSFFELMAISLIAHRALPKKIQKEIRKGIYFNEEGTLMVVLDKIKLEISDYRLAAEEFLRLTQININRSSVYLQILPSLAELSGACMR